MIKGSILKKELRLISYYFTGLSLIGLIITGFIQKEFYMLLAIGIITKSLGGKENV